MQEKTYIYVLKDPRTNQIRYVGKSNNPKYRYQNHINKYELKTKKLVKEWITPNEAAKELKLSAIAIAQCARGSSKSSGGFYWSYEKINNKEEKI